MDVGLAVVFAYEYLMLWKLLPAAVIGMVVIGLALLSDLILIRQYA